MIKHIVLFKLKEMPEKQVHLQDLKNELEKLTTIIPELKELKVGLNANPAESWDFCLEAVVADLEALDVYAKHPAHQAIVKSYIAPYKEERACVDYVC